MLVWTSMLGRPRRRALLSASAFVLASLFVGHLASFYGWSLVWTAAAVTVFLITLRSVGAALWFLSREPLSTCDLGLPEMVWPGGVVGVALEIRARRRVRIQEARVTLTGERRDLEGRTHILFRETRVLATETTLTPGERLRREDELPVPADAPASWRLEQERVRWIVAASVRAKGFATVREQLVIPVTPLPADGSSERRSTQRGTETTNAS